MIDVTHRNGEILYASSAKDISSAIKEALNNNADLSGADLQGADLRDDDLYALTNEELVRRVSSAHLLSLEDGFQCAELLRRFTAGERERDRLRSEVDKANALLADHRPNDAADVIRRALSAATEGSEK